MGKRAGWMLADQAVSSLANAGLSIVIARTVSAEEFGAFALTFSIYSLLLALSQAVTGQPLLIGYSAATDPVRGKAFAAAAGTSVVLGFVSAVVVAVVAVTLQAPLRDVLLALGVLLPALMLQDTWRTVFITKGTPRQAFTNDAVWTGLQVLLIGMLLAGSATRAVWYVLAWGGAAAVAALYGMKQSALRPEGSATGDFLRKHRDVSIPSIANAMVTLGAAQVAFVLFAFVGSVEVVGALRAAQTLLGPLNIVGFALASFTVPEIIRRDLSRRGQVLAAVALSGTLVAVDLLWGGLLLLLPEHVGEQLLGDTWAQASKTLPGLVVFTACIAATTGATSVMRALARPTYVLWVSALLGPLLLGLSVGGLALFGTAGAAWGFALAAGLVIPPAWLLLARAVREGRPMAAESV